MKGVSGTVNTDRLPTDAAGALDTPVVRPDAPANDVGGAGGSIPPRADAGGSSCTPGPTPLQAGEPCTCDKECATGFCQEGVCCGGAACESRPAGAPCTNANQCESNFCADGVCCNVACDGACVSCGLPDREGECVSVPAGMPDVHGVCRSDAPESCGQSGLCNGQGGCAKYGAGSPCGIPSCSNTNTLTPASECDGEGACIKSTAITCAPFGCEGGNCRSTCTDDSQCVAPATCINGSCGKRGKGSACTANDQCGTGFCVDGVCCENACAGKCQYCANPSARGTCAPVRAGVMDPRASAGLTDPARACLDQGPASCGDDGRCDGNGGCQKYANGTPCRAGRCDATANTETGAATCQGGTCRVPAARSCAPFRGCNGVRCVAQCGSDAQCAAPNVCADGTCGKRAVGAQCSRNEDCAAPGICAQGRCCSGPCNSACVSCNLAGTVGTCTPVPVGGADPSNTCRDDACNNGCNGAGGCRREAVGTSCGAATCSGTTIMSRTCSAEGACLTSSSPCPTGQMCMGNRCVMPAKAGLGEACVAGGDCASGACVGGRCCASACGDACKQCTAATMWQCGNKPNGIDCGGGRTCTAGVCAKKPAGAVCQDGVECQSGSCVGTRCCANSCSGPPCKTCNAASAWACVNLPNETSCGGELVCRAGSCVTRCPTGQITCDGACVNPDNSPVHCGGCRIACGPGATCIKGKCSGGGDDECKGNLTSCNGVCVNTKVNAQNCGTCGNVCPLLRPFCRNGVCSLAVVDPRPGPGNPPQEP
jgi:hypothetical protein